MKKVSPCSDLESLFGNVPFGVVLYNLDGKLIYGNSAASKITGIEASKLGESSIHEARIIDERSKHLVTLLSDRQRKDATTGPSIIFLSRDNGSNVTIEATTSHVVYDSQDMALVFFRDITLQEKTEEKLRESEDRFSKAFHFASNPITVSRLHDGIILDMNDAFLDTFGFSRDDLLTSSTADLGIWVNKDDFSAILAKIKAGEYVRSQEISFRKKSGEVITGLFSAQPIMLAKETCILSNMVDITSIKKANEKIARLSIYDALTGLFNRGIFEEELKRLDTEREYPLSIIMADLDGLKITNDAFGHLEGDQLLIRAATTFKKVLRDEDIIARWGGDEFVVLLPRTTKVKSERIVRRINRQCKSWKDQQVPLHISMGTDTKSQSDQDITDTMKKAEENMYKQKLCRRDTVSNSIISTLEKTLNEKSFETKDHSDRLKLLARKLGISLNLSPEMMNDLSILTTLHDIGKVTIDGTILEKKSPLTESEWEIMKEHPTKGYNIAWAIPQIRHIADSLLSCHEKWDGSGYPRGLAGTSISLLSRIIYIVDSYDVMTHDRPYKSAMTKAEAIAELRRCSGSDFDPELVEKLVAILQSRYSSDGFLPSQE